MMSDRVQRGRAGQRRCSAARSARRLGGARCVGACVAAFGFALLWSSAVRAQVPAAGVNPGAIQTDIDRQRQQFEQGQQPPRQQGPAVIGPEREKSQALKPGGPKFRLRRLKFDHSKFLTKEELKTIGAKYVGKDVDISALQQLVADINALYAQKGIVTGIATLPEQDANDGIVHIKLTEGRLEKMTVTGNTLTSSGYILHRVEEPVGEVLDVPKLNRDVTWFNRTNDVQVRALLQPGSSFGLTDINYAVTEPPRDTLQLFYDNQGVQTTGEVEQGVFYRRYGLFGVDDRLTFYGVHADGNLNGNIAYNVAINDWGGRLGVSYTQGRIQIVDGPFLPLDVEGESRIAAMNFSQPLWATESWLVLANLAVNYGTTRSDFTGVPVVNDYYWKGTGGGSFTYTTSTYSITVAPAFNQIAWHDYILGGDRSFETFTATASAQIKLPERFSIAVLGSAQATGERLLPGDQVFVIGGPTTVRGYPTNAATGDSGYYYNVELHYDWTELAKKVLPTLKGLDTYIFVDDGAVYSVAPAEIELLSVGAGMSWSPIAPLTFEAVYGAPLLAAVPIQPHYQVYGRVIFKPLLIPTMLN
jgi:hemolysin activation/secretion protein